MDVLILNSGEWVLSEELDATPWHVLIYRERGEPNNELHLWLPHRDSRRSGELAFKRYWIRSGTRWCVEVPGNPARNWGVSYPRATRLRFTSADGRVLWAEHRGGRSLGDLSDRDLQRLLDVAQAEASPLP